MLKNEGDWDPIQVNFLKEHRFFTQTAVQYRRLNKVDRLEEIKAKLKAKAEGDENRDVDSSNDSSESN